MFAFFFFVYICCLYIQIRNAHVYKERQIILDIIFQRDDWRELIMLKDTVSYDSMMYKFWVWPISKMWPPKLRELRKK